MGEYSGRFKFQNGDFVREKITGFEGTITGTAFYITGCNQYLIVGKSKDNNEAPALWFDEGRLELDKSKLYSVEDIESKDNCCDILPNIGKKGY